MSLLTMIDFLLLFLLHFTGDSTYPSGLGMVRPHLFITLWMPSHRLPSTEAYALCLFPLALHTTRTGLPVFQSSASAPSLSLKGALPFRTRARFTLVSFWSHVCKAVRLLPLRSQPPLSV
ncbi:hypothetical protein GDO81_000818 [Engystomops pustulosus]|uniref:Secreted protein n=1 Tax=Engystomops pustulosus TaxID=76066 RepID=A0AAV7D7J7_ENGPU|nr:hypothetical protein GDO81_000818 [Engystomops pustulosus]